MIGDYFSGEDLQRELNYDEGFFREFSENPNQINFNEIRKYIANFCKITPNLIGLAGIITASVTKIPEFVFYSLAVGEILRLDARSEIGFILDFNEEIRKKRLEEIKNKERTLDGYKKLGVLQ